MESTIGFANQKTRQTLFPKGEDDISEEIHLELDLPSFDRWIYFLIIHLYCWSMIIHLSWGSWVFYSLQSIYPTASLFNIHKLSSFYFRPFPAKFLNRLRFAIARAISGLSELKKWREMQKKHRSRRNGPWLWLCISRCLMDFKFNHLSLATR